MDRILIVEKRLRALAKIIDKKLQINGVKMGFALIVFEFNKPGIGNYISNTTRADMVEALRETADRIEKNEDVPPVISDVMH